MKVILAVLIASVSLPLHAHAQLHAQVIATGLSQPVALVPDPYFGNVLYIVEQSGLVKVLVDGQLQAAPFADLRSAIATGGERGLLGMAFAPDVFTGRVFFNFTNTDGHTVIARFVRTAASPFQVVASSRFDLRWDTGEGFIRQPFANHNGGNLAFGPDGYLYIGLGDGGSANDPQNAAQNPATLLGKMLRIDVAVADGDPAGYRVPADNPFRDGTPIPALAEIWTFGLRNPWRYSFDDVGVGATGALVIADVGQGAREEINYEPAGASGRNYGWRIREGRLPTEGVDPTTPAYGPLTDPVFDYDRTHGQAVTGGYVYRGTALPAPYRGRYFFADFITSRVWSLALSVHPATGEATASNRIDHTGELGGALGGVASFGRDRDGELYIVTFAGRVLKIVPLPGSVPNAPENLTAVVSGSTVTVSWQPPSSGGLPSGYQLEAGSVSGAADFGVVPAAASQTSLTFPNIPQGVYFARVRSLGAAGASGPSNEAVITVRPCVQPPPVPASFGSAVNGRLVTLTWAVPATADGPAQFVIEAGSETGAANLAILAVDGVWRALSVEAPAGHYFVRIRGVNACGSSAPSAEIVVTVF
ncbi:MAG TPA: PQQ-dependent sugar dehydrogenase [Vicinamibacterales bacterium]|nr:PQQ-dependent sugar dehydrogenase [Vicinamibacterales bacterium]